MHQIMDVRPMLAIQHDSYYVPRTNVLMEFWGVVAEPPRSEEPNTCWVPIHPKKVTFESPHDPQMPQ